MAKSGYSLHWLIVKCCPGSEHGFERVALFVLLTYLYFQTSMPGEALTYLLSFYHLMNGVAPADPADPALSMASNM